MIVVAFKHPDWTGRVAVITNTDGTIIPVRLDGVYYRGQVTGRRIDRPRERWYFVGPGHDVGIFSLPEWVHLLPKSVVVTRPPRPRSRCEDCGCELARYLGEPETHEPDCSNFPL